MSVAAAVTIHLPDWLVRESGSFPEKLNTVEEKMNFAIALSAKQVEHQSGGPFGAAIFCSQSGALISAGVNLVVPENTAIAHAEVVAFALAQQKLKSFNLSSEAGESYQLFTSSQMCAMCLGATIWSGVNEVYIAATRDEVEGIAGFDEGPIHPEWRDELQERGIAVTEDVCRDQAVSVLKRYRDSGGLIYNGDA